jgi:hypothetical protein
MNFRVGQKVVCVDAGGTVCVVKGGVYDVVGIKGEFLHLDRLETAAICLGGMLATRFRPAVENKTDISVFTKILDDVSRKVSADAVH